jgi:hypothetical protein
MSKLETNTIDTISGTTNLTIGSTNTSSITLGASGDTITVPNGALSGQNYPAFEAYLSSAQSISDLTTTKVEFDTEVFDTDNCYDNSTNYRFTPTKAGKYFVFTKIGTDTIAGANLDQVRVLIYKNGSTISIANLDARGNTLGSYYTCNDSTVIDMNGSSDYLEIFAINGGDPDRITSFGAYRIGA